MLTMHAVVDISGGGAGMFLGRRDPAVARTCKRSGFTGMLVPRETQLNVRFWV